MQRHSLQANTPEWLAHRSTCFNASDAPAMLGCGLKTRSELLREVHTSLAREVSSYVQERIFDPGHRFEELARPLAEEIIGEDLGRVVGSLDVGLSKPLGASFDGITFMDDVTLEHKRLNAELRSVFDLIDQGARVADVLPKMYRVQMEQQFMVAEEAKRGLFMASEWRGDELVEERHCWYESDPALRAEILAGWKQFDADLATYVPPEPAAPAPVAKPVAHLPVVFDLRVEGKLVACNLEQYKPAALAYIDGINTDLVKDQDFADATADAKFCRESAAKLKLAVQQAMGRMGDVNAAINAALEIAAAFDAKGLALEKKVKTETDARREAIVLGGAAALQAHTKALNQRIGQHLLPLVKADFAGAIKGKRNLDSMQNAVDTELARAKIAANEVADRIQINLAKLNERADLAFLFPDVAQIVLKAADDLQALVTSRITAHEAKEAARLEAERARIRAEEEAKAQREAAQKVAAEQAAARAISQAAAPAVTSVAAPVVTPAAPVVTAPAPDVSPVTAMATAPAANSTVVPMTRTASNKKLRLGEICEALGFAVTADFLGRLGFQPAETERAAKLYWADDLPRICQALINHLTAIGQRAAA